MTGIKEKVTIKSLSPSQRTLLADLEQEAGTNVFQVIINETRIV